MAEVNISVAQDQFSCSVCLDLLKDPVTILCGHSFCMGCINCCWDQEDQKRIYSCPQCRQTFTPRPVVSKNTILAEVVETMKKTRLQAARPFRLQPHYESPAFKKHKLVKASRRLQEQICSQHDKPLEVYCRTDQQCICILCTMDEHKGHDTISAAAGRAEKQKQLLGIQGKSKQSIQDREKELQKLRSAVETHKRSAQTAVQESERIFTELIKSTERRRSEMTDVIRAQEKAAVSRAEEVMKQLEREIADLKRRDAQLEKLSHTEDHIQYLQSFQSVSTPTGPSNFPTITLSSLLTFEDAIKSVSQLRGKLEECCKGEFEKISSGVRDVQILPSPLPAPVSTPKFQRRVTWEDFQILPPPPPVSVSTLTHQSRETSIAVLKDKEPGSFIVRDSYSFKGAYGKAKKVAAPPPPMRQQSTKVRDVQIFPPPLPASVSTPELQSIEDSIAMLKDNEPGSFILCDSYSFKGAYGKAKKVATPPPPMRQQSTMVLPLFRSEKPANQ